ncbi:UDP-N-acetylglucosamine--N-acetylmuramyl-(pentapeptide) pyrophosphoryl-undecaprenol N-acetylglucosamine transferase [Candidatus Roizmanbacteria bacterium]|jgi:UDP-N-acetylglucosamine--N-acetylmuramyl-(pentapeptide) pyrophosphoryl-undecaprenol N-acetylglucosamine transferase|nr:UDP-N-acetylglucosamine--N-acetylmuramyl-(pentapeptide) pyrophosphoryl-undecaprenol N-acetylglucosamine transferase [Candidatus Roizmanbacteria bacterium]
MKILVTGGHLTPALSVIDRIIDLGIKNVEIVFVGRKHALSAESSLSMEYQELKKRNIRFIDLAAGRVTRILSIGSLKNIFKVPGGFWEAWKIVYREKPDKILSFGGYIGLPIVVAGYLKKIPVFIHEQTIHPGLANKISGYLASRIFVSFPQTLGYFSGDKTVVTGNPLRREIFRTVKKPFEVKKDRPVIYVTGGSLGSHNLNQLVGDLVPLLLDRYIVIHQVGNVKQFDDIVRLQKIRSAMPPEKQKNYFIREHFFTDEVGYVFDMADLVISRSGANTFFELIALDKPAILIPLPWSAHQEQQKQAQILNEMGAVEIFYEHGKSVDLYRLIEKILPKLGDYKSAYKQLNIIYKQDAADKIIEAMGIG